MKFVIIGIIYVGIIFVAALVQAQLIVWGLSMFHVNSGIWGPYLMSAALESIIAGGVRTGGKK
jgi:hypothetical protein